MPTNKKLWEDIKEAGEIVGEGEKAEEYKLDFSEASLKRLDQMIIDLWGDDGPSKKSYDNLIWVFGSYIALIVDKNFKGVWTKNSNNQEIWFGASKSGVKFSPYNWIAKKFEFGDSLESKYTAIADMIEKDKK